MEIKEIKANENTTIPEVEVVSVGDVREFEKFGKVGRVCTIKIKDASGEAELSLWNDDIGKFALGDKLKITDAWVKEWKGKLQISAGKNGKIEKI